MSGFDYNSMMALKDLIGGEEEDPSIVENPYKGSMINPGQIGGDGEKKEIAKPNAKIEAKIGERYQPKNKKEENKEKEPEKEKDKVEYKSKKVDPKH